MTIKCSGGRLQCCRSGFLHCLKLYFPNGSIGYGEQFAEVPELLDVYLVSFVW
jgi:hypothetical protein